MAAVVAAAIFPVAADAACMPVEVSAVQAVPVPASEAVCMPVVAVFVPLSVPVPASEAAETVYIQAVAVQSVADVAPAVSVHMPSVPAVSLVLADIIWCQMPGNIYILGKEFRNVPVEVDGGIVSFLIVGNEYIVDGTLSEEVSLAIREELSRRSPQAVNLLELAYASLSGGTYYYLGLSTQEGAFSVDGTGRYTLAGDVDGYDSWSFSIETGDPYYVLEQDLTAYYQELYPEEGIDCVAIRSRCEKPAEYYWFEHYFLSALVE